LFFCATPPCIGGDNPYPVHSYGTQHLPQTINQWGMMKHQKEKEEKERKLQEQRLQYEKEHQERLDKLHREKMKFERETKATDEIFKLIEMAVKYPSLADKFFKRAQEISDEENLGFDFTK